jgi:hypothetical protein
MAFAGMASVLLTLIHLCLKCTNSSFQELVYSWVLWLVHTNSGSSSEADAIDHLSPEIQGQPGLHSKTLSEEINKKKLVCEGRKQCWYKSVCQEGHREASERKAWNYRATGLPSCGKAQLLPRQRWLSLFHSA